MAQRGDTSVSALCSASNNNFRRKTDVYTRTRVSVVLIIQDGVRRLEGTCKEKRVCACILRASRFSGVRTLYFILIYELPRSVQQNQNDTLIKSTIKIGNRGNDGDTSSGRAIVLNYNTDGRASEFR